MSVRENRLVSMAIFDHDYVLRIERAGRGWVLELDGTVVAFAVADNESGSIWALFVDPQHERNGYGHQLHDVMVAWLWEQGHSLLWLTTEPGTRAERLYRKAGWQPVGTAAGGEIRFELRRPDDAPQAIRKDGRA